MVILLITLVALVTLVPTQVGNASRERKSGTQVGYIVFGEILQNLSTKHPTI